MANPVSQEKAKKILEHGEVRGEPLTEDQEDFFGAIAGGEDVSDSPPQGVQGFTQTPNASGGQPEPPDKFSNLPNRSDPATADPPPAENRADAAAGNPGPVQNFGSGAEQRGTTPQTLRTETGPATPGEQASQPDRVQEFDQGSDV